MAKSKSTRYIIDIEYASHPGEHSVNVSVSGPDDLMAEYHGSSLSRVMNMACKEIVKNESA